MFILLFRSLLCHCFKVMICMYVCYMLFNKYSMTHVTCRLTAKNRDQLRNPTLGNRVWATFTFTFYRIACTSPKRSTPRREPQNDDCSRTTRSCTYCAVRRIQKFTVVHVMYTSTVQSRTKMTIITTVRYQGNAPTDTFNANRV